MLEQQNRETDEYSLPARRTIHPSNRGKWAKIFYIAILIAFIILIISMISLFLYFSNV